jgi:hypothetical protein
VRLARFIVAGRRLAVSVLAVLAALVVVTACSSSTAGSGKNGGGFGGGGGTGSSAPSTGSGGGGGGSAPAGGGSSGDFCTEWSKSGATGGLTGGQVQSTFVAHWDKLAAIAPGAIKSDVQTVDSYLHSALSGHPDPSKAADIATAVSNIVQWVAQNCH